MLQVARLAPKALGDAASRVEAFFRSQQNSDSGFKNRAGKSDLYYTPFGFDGLRAVAATSAIDLPSLTYLASCGDGRSLDLVHLACLARCWGMLSAEALNAGLREALVARLESFTSGDGGYNASAGAEAGTLYGAFLALGMYQDLRLEFPRPREVAQCIHSLRTADGGYANQRDFPLGLTPTTAAAVTLLRQLHEPVDAAAGDWLISRVHADGGFFATPAAPIPDLLSTATALHALAGMQRDFDSIKEKTLDFIDTLWSSQGAFFGNWEDDVLDCEYTFYGLLAVGHLSL